jgi:hypothetical protein
MECVITIVIHKLFLFTLLHGMFKLVQMSGHYMNTSSAAINYHLMTKREQTQGK